jgi:hypothetical protein
MARFLLNPIPFAMTNAVVAASPPTMAVCHALQNGRGVVKRRLTYPAKIAFAQQCDHSRKNGGGRFDPSVILRTNFVWILVEINFDRRRDGLRGKTAARILSLLTRH